MFLSLVGGMLAGSPQIAQSREAAHRGRDLGKPKLALVAGGGWGVLKGRDELGQRWEVGCLDCTGLWENGQRLGVSDLSFFLLTSFAPSAIFNPKQSKDAPKSFTFDYSYWSHTSVRLLGWGKLSCGRKGI